MAIMVFIAHDIEFNGSHSSQALPCVGATRSEMEENPTAIIWGIDGTDFDPSTNQANLFLCTDGMLRRNADGSYIRLDENDPSIPDYDKSVAAENLATAAKQARPPKVIWFGNENIASGGDFTIYPTTGTLEQLNDNDFPFIDAATNRYPDIGHQPGHLFLTSDGQLVRWSLNSDELFEPYHPPAVNSDKVAAFFAQHTT